MKSIFNSFFTLITCSILSSQVIAAGVSYSPQMSIIPTSTAPITVTSASATTVTYNVTANATMQNIQVSPSSAEYPVPSYVSASLSSDTCTGTTKASGGTCSFTLSLQSQSGTTGSFTLSPRVSANGGASNSMPVASNRIAVTVGGSAPPASVNISANVATALFSFNDVSSSGTVGTGKSVITLTNNDATAAATNITAATPLPSGITESATTCGGSLAASASCQITFTTTATPDSTQTISIAGDNTNTISLPIAPLSVRVYSPPVSPSPSNASLMVVKTCTTPEQLLLTNNSGSDISTISVTKDSGLSDVSLAGVMDNCPTTLPAGKSCVLGITAPSSSGSTNTQGNILINWGSAQNGAVLTGVEATGATLPDLSTPIAPVTVYGGYVYQEDATCNLVKVAALADQYTGSGSVAWTTSDFTGITVPNPATSSGTGAQNTGLAAGQINTTAVIYQAGAALTTYASGLCAQYLESDGGNNYVGWYLPWDNGDVSGTTTTELAAMWQNLSQGASDNGFNNSQFYWSSSEDFTHSARARFFVNGDPLDSSKDGTGDYVRCSRALTY